MFDIARIAAETKKIENDIYRDFITHTSNYEDSVDLEKFRRLIPEEKIVWEMSSEMFEELRQKLFHTNLSFFDKAIERAKTGKKEQSFEA